MKWYRVRLFKKAQTYTDPSRLRALWMAIRGLKFDLKRQVVAQSAEHRVVAPRIGVRNPTT